MAEKSIPDAIEELNRTLKGKGEAGAQLAINRILAREKCPAKPAASKGNLDGKLVRFYDYGRVRCFGGEQIILVAGPAVEACVVLGSEIAKGENGIYIKTQSDSRAQADADARALRASKAMQAPAPKRVAAPPKPAAAVPPARRASAARALRADAARETTPAVEVVVVPDAPKRHTILPPRRSYDGGRSMTRRAGGEGSYMSPAQERAEMDRIQREAERAQAEAAKAEQQSKGLAEAQQLIAALRAMKKGG